MSGCLCCCDLIVFRDENQNGNQTSDFVSARTIIINELWRQALHSASAAGGHLALGAAARLLSACVAGAPLKWPRIALRARHLIAILVSVTYQSAEVEHNREMNLTGEWDARPRPQAQ